MNGLTFEEFSQSSIPDLQSAGFAGGLRMPPARDRSGYGMQWIEDGMAFAGNAPGLAFLENHTGMNFPSMRRGILLQPLLRHLAEHQGPQQGSGYSKSELASRLDPPFSWSGKAAKENTWTTCIVCLSDFKDGEQCRMLPCDHVFHVACIDEWLVRSPKCPICKDLAVEGPGGIDTRNAGCVGCNLM